MKNVTNLQLRRKLAEALESGRFMITITYLRGSQLQHYLNYQRFPGEDLLSTLDHFAGEIMKHEEGNIKAPSVTGRHINDDPGGSGSETDIPKLEDRRKDSMPRDMGEQPESDSTE